MERNIEVRARRWDARFAQQPVELCEHKGIGHPDTLTDGFCEAASRELSRAYRRQCGRVLHHNLDKGLLIAGRSEPRFGGGRVVKPMRAILCGRATPLPNGADASQLAVDAARRYLATQTGLDIRAADVVGEIGETSADLRQVFEAARAVSRANDTSFGVGYAPHSALEQCVLDLAAEIRSESFRAAFPAAGIDFKIMGCRREHDVSITVALALIDRHVNGIDHYFAIKQAMHDRIAARLTLPARIRINALDDAHARDESGVYLTVTGLSAEMGDDGQVGRGNRANGLITPGRPMSLEATAGKNPVSHVGKLYNVLALLIARDLHRQLDGSPAVTVQLLSAIGDPVDQPQLASIDIVGPHDFSAAARSHAARIADQWLSDIARVTDLILDERVTLY